MASATIPGVTRATSTCSSSSIGRSRSSGRGTVSVVLTSSYCLTWLLTSLMTSLLPYSLNPPILPNYTHWLDLLALGNGVEAIDILTAEHVEACLVRVRARTRIRVRVRVGVRVRVRAKVRVGVGIEDLR